MLFLELIPDFLVAQNTACNIGHFCANSSGERERNYFIITAMQWLMDKGLSCATFPADTEQNSEPAAKSLQSKYRANGSN